MIVRYDGIDYRLEEPVGPRRGWMVRRSSDERLFRMNARQLGQAEIRGANH